MKNFPWHRDGFLAPVESQHGFLLATLIISHSKEHLDTARQLIRELGQALLSSFTDKEGRFRKMKLSVQITEVTNGGERTHSHDSYSSYTATP